MADLADLKISHEEGKRRTRTLRHPLQRERERANFGPQCSICIHLIFSVFIPPVLSADFQRYDEV